MKIVNRPQTLKGFRDFLPEEALARQWLKKRLEEIFESWGYDPIETPTLEPLEIFKGEIGEGEKIFYKFKDQGGRSVALRYDQTVPTCRFVGQYSETLPMPFRRYQIQPTFRAENPQKGRYREFLQADADIFGVSSPLADAETIALSLDIFRQLGFKKAIVLINDRELLKDIPYEAIIAIDKLKKIGDEGVIKEMAAKGISREKAAGYLTYVKNLKPNKTIQIILDYLEASGFEKDWYKFAPMLARSFSYSTGPIWEVEIPGFESGSVVGGERYDKTIVNICEKNIPGTGFALGFDRTLEAAQQFGLVPKKLTTTKVLITIFSPELLPQSAKTANLLRKSGINAELYPDENVKLDKQLKYADKKGIPFVLIIGPDEAKNGTATLKSLQTKEQTTVPASELTKIILK